MAPTLAEYGGLTDLLDGTLMWRNRNAANQAQAGSGSIRGQQNAGRSIEERDALGIPIGGWAGVGVGAALILAAVVFVLVKIFQRRAEHKRFMAAQDEAQRSQSIPGVAVVEIPRPVSYARQGGLNPLHSQAGWGALSSDENVHNNQPNGKRLSQMFGLGNSSKKRNSIAVPKRVRQKGIPLRRFKHLSRITESPRSRVERSPSPAAHGPDSNVQDTPLSTRTAKALTYSVPEDGDVFVCPGSPKAETVPSFAIGMAKLRQPNAAAPGIAGTKAVRSKSMGTVRGGLPDDAIFGGIAQPDRPSTHARSYSWGAQAMTRPPSGPVPPLPVISPLEGDADSASRQGVCVRRTSSASSHESAGSSVLVSSPILTMRKNKPATSPSVEQLIAEDEGAELKTVDQQHESPVVASSQPVSNVRREAAVRSAMAQYSDDSRASARLSHASTVSSILSSDNRLSIPQVRTADRVSISRVSSTGSLTPSPVVTKFASTPIRKASRPNSTTVSLDGSPAQRKKKKHVLRDISGNAMLAPSRQPSNSTQSSSRSSNGNPFQWDGPMQVCRQPSALKGSPNARKGHRRQNCVRISTLTPQILGPPPSRPTSPGLMDGIEEEGTDGEEVMQQKKSVGFASNTNTKRISRPPSTSEFAPNLNVKTLRASLTPSSPTLSTWTAYHEPNVLPSRPSASTLSVPSPNRGKRHSDQSSVFSIPTFPSPSKATVSKIQTEQPVPEFYLSRPSTDTYYSSDKENLGSSPPAFVERSWHREHQDYIPSSPPLPSHMGNGKEYDPAWPMITIPAPQSSNEYDPASPALYYSSPSQYGSSPPAFHFANAASPESAVSPRSRPVSHVGGEMPDTPPCSPKTMPEGFEDFFQKKRQSVAPVKLVKSPPATTSQPSRDKLTSANASTVMAKLPQSRAGSITSKNGLEAFPGAPVLPPPTNSPPAPPPKSTARAQRAVSISQDQQTHLKPLRDAPQPPLPSPSPSITIPSPLNIAKKATLRCPLGPRSEPAKSVLKNAMALRRMNSEIDCTTRSSSPDEIPHRGPNRYARLGREPSPLLPFIASPAAATPNDPGAGLFDFEFGIALSSDADAGAEDQDNDRETYDDAKASALDDIDLDALERRISGAVAGFDAQDELLPTVPEERSSSVWEDGERYWEWLEQKKQRELRGSFAAGSGVATPTGEKGEAMAFTLAGVGTLGGKAGWVPCTPAEKRLRDQSSPGGATPRSLYDADGFLREGSAVKRR
ncbi:hypothetical protein MBLNU230_g0562t1 [Neophaeotheca triangularis]